MSDPNNNSSLQSIFSQVLREIQTGINRLEQTVNQAAAQPGTTATPPRQGGFPPVEEVNPAQAQPTPRREYPPYTGQRWEYKVVYVNFRGQISSEGDQIIIGKGERRSSFVRQYLDDLGQQGWELSGVSPLGDTENSYFVFKRPATGERPAPQTSSASTTASRGGQRVQVEEVDENNPIADL